MKIYNKTWVLIFIVASLFVASLGTMGFNSNNHVNEPGVRFLKAHHNVEEGKQVLVTLVSDYHEEEFTTFFTAPSNTSLEKSLWKVNFPVGVNVVSVPIKTVDDDEVEWPETIMLRIQSGEGHSLNTPNVSYITINDNDANTIGFESKLHSVVEGKQYHVDVTVMRYSGLVNVDIPFVVEASEYYTGLEYEYFRATPDVDYHWGKYPSLIPAGESAATVRIIVYDDKDAEPIENFLLKVSVEYPHGISDAHKKSVVKILDND